MRANGGGQQGACTSFPQEGLGALAIVGASRTRTINEDMEVADRASRWSWRGVTSGVTSKPLGHRPSLARVAWMRVSVVKPETQSDSRMKH